MRNESSASFLKITSTIVQNESCSGSRHSSVSIHFPAGSDIGNQNCLMPPPCASRLSTTSAWNSIRLSALSLSRVGLEQIVFFLKPCSKHKCCLGCISLRDAIPLICIVELFILVFCSTIAIDFWITDGKSFYTVQFEGYGQDIAIIYLIFLFFSLLVITFTLIVWHNKKRKWYIIHVIWQWTLIELFAFFMYTVAVWVDKPNSILLPSAIVLGTLSFLGFIIEIWWFIIFLDAMLFEKQRHHDSRRTSHEESVTNSSPDQEI